MTRPTGRTGFEIRAELLILALEILDNNRKQEVNAWHEWNVLHPEEKRDPVINIVSAEEVIEVARQLKGFVDEK